MLYAIMATDVKNSLEKRIAVRPEHIKRLEDLKNEGRLVLAGPHPKENEEGFSGSLVVAEFESFNDARTWANEDPYFKSGAYESVIVKPFKKVLP
ncbi:YciL protein [hydrothermal vent metagenome]|uniref:YciL protein n=1 Tax=hydrothermal vent metagenome TaxID=652676 RepID=A0A1W1BG23_9ZZZZ